MELPIYETLNDFKYNYLIDFSEIQPKTTFLRYLVNCKESYDNYFRQIQPKFVSLQLERNDLVSTLEIYDRGSINEYYSKDEISVMRSKVISFNEEIVNKRALFGELYFIGKFLSEEIIKEKERMFLNVKSANVLEEYELPEFDYSGKNELKPKEKLIVLDKLGVIDLLVNKLKYDDNATHLAEIIGAITGIDNTKGTLTGYCNFLLRRDDLDKNSPYYSTRTVENVKRILHTFKLNDDDYS